MGKTGCRLDFGTTIPDPILNKLLFTALAHKPAVLIPSTHDSMSEYVNLKTLVILNVWNLN